MKHVFGVDVGGTSIKFSIVNEAGSIVDRWSISTNTADSGSHIAGDIRASLEQRRAMHDQPVVAVGVGVPGPVSGDMVERAVNLGWTDVLLGSVLRESLGLPVALLNDANAAALGEAWMGTGEDGAMIGSAVFVTLGTGVGGGIVVDGKVLNGAHGCGGEIGHMPVKADGARTCGCGSLNCLECYASATGFVRTANELAEQAGYEQRFSSGEEVFALVAEGDPVAVRARDLLVDQLAHSLAGIVSTIDPEEVIVGGGLSHAGDALMVPLGERLNEYVFPALRGRFVLRRATLGNDAGMLGAAYQALQLV